MVMARTYKKKLTTKTTLTTKKNGHLAARTRRFFLAHASRQRLKNGFSVLDRKRTAPALLTPRIPEALA